MSTENAIRSSIAAFGALPLDTQQLGAMACHVGSIEHGHELIRNRLKAALHAIIDAYNAPRYMGMYDVRESKIREQVSNATNLLLELHEQQLEAASERQ